MGLRLRAPCVAVLLGLSIPPAAPAATIAVTTTADPTPSGCGLRDAIAAANGDAPVGGCPAGSGADLIDLSGLGGEIHLGLGLPPAELPALQSQITIRGPGANQLVLNGDGNVRVFVTYGYGEAIVIEDSTGSPAIATARTRN